MIFGSKYKIQHISCALCCLLGATAVSAADVEGNYAIRGVGGQSCEVFVQSTTTGGQDMALFLRWIEGYLSGMNRLSAQTYDHSPIISLPTLGQLVVGVCSSDSEQRFEVAVARVLNALFPYRDEAVSEILTISHEGREVQIRQGTLARMQEKLSDKGLYQSVVDGLYGPGTRAALEAFQESEGLVLSGIPDADTLLRLFMGED